MMLRLWSALLIVQCLSQGSQVVFSVSTSDAPHSVSQSHSANSVSPPAVSTPQAAIWTSHPAVSSAPHPRIKENCREHFEGYEGVRLKGFHLQRVFVATTSGLRIPNIRGGLSAASCTTVQSCFCNFKIHNLDTVRHFLETLQTKQKFPNKKFDQLKQKKFQGKKSESRFKSQNSSPDGENCKSQSLSSFGVSQMINLGAYFSKSYFRKLKSFDSVLQHPEFAGVVGDETLIHSLNAFLYGLLTEKQFLYTDINTSTSSSGVTRSSLPEHASSDLSYFVEKSFVEEVYLFKESRVAEFKKRNLMEKLFGSHASAKDVIEYVSNVICYAYLSVEEAPRLLSDDISDVFNMSDFYNHYLTSSSVFQQDSFSRVLALMQDITEWSREGGDVNDNDDFRVVAVSDLFMLSLLTAFSVPVTKHLSPSSRLVIESYIPDTESPICHYIVSVNHYVASRQVFLQKNKVSVSDMKPGEADSHSQKFLINKTSNEIVETFEGGQISELNKLLVFSQEDKISASRLMKSQPSLSSVTAFKVKGGSERDGSVFDQRLPVYIRVLYNGQVVTSGVPGCEADHMIGLGLCSLESFEVLLSMGHIPVRDEL